jgi:hypothetical protein
MSDRADINVEDLRSFIGALQSFNGKLEGDWGQLKSRWQASSESWRDSKKDQFTDAVGWDEVIRMMEGYLSTSEQYANFLKRLEQRATDYLES